MSCLLCERVRRVHNTSLDMLNASETHSCERKVRVTHAMHAVTKQVVRRWRETKKERSRGRKASGDGRLEGRETKMPPHDTDWCSLLETHLRTAGDRGGSACMAALGLLGTMAPAPTGRSDRSARGEGDRGAMTLLVQKERRRWRRKAKSQAASTLARPPADQARASTNGFVTGWSTGGSCWRCRKPIVIAAVSRRLERRGGGALSSGLSQRVAGSTGSRRPPGAWGSPTPVRA
jgi:hypothetical protein